MNQHVQIKRLKIRRSYPLNTRLEQKIEDSKEFSGWTVFLNNRHNIAHIMSDEGSGGYYRMRCRSVGQGLKTYSDDQLLLYFFVRLNKLLVL